MKNSARAFCRREVAKIYRPRYALAGGIPVDARTLAEEFSRESRSVRKFAKMKSGKKASKVAGKTKITSESSGMKKIGCESNKNVEGYEYSRSVIEKSTDIYHNFPSSLDSFVLENPVVYRSDGRIERLVKGNVNGKFGIYHITTKGNQIIHRTFIPMSDWERFANVNGLPALSNIPDLK